MGTIATRRLANQILTGTPLRRASEVVGWFGAMQAQEYEPAKWAIGLRVRKATAAGLDREIDEGRILRTHVMRPTWHFVRREDIRWLIALTAPRVHQAIAYHARHVDLDRRTLVRGASVIERALGNGAFLTRQELGEQLRRARLPMAGQRLAHMVMHAELEAIVCSGPRRGKHFTYALLADRAGRPEHLAKDEALARLCSRFFASHGPATIRDFAWWSGLTVADCKRGLEVIRARSEAIGGITYWTTARQRPAGRDDLVHLLPIYDEYLVAYRDRIAVPHATLFRHALVIAGQVAGSWRPVRRNGLTMVDLTPSRPLTRRERQAAEQATRRYVQFA